MLRDCFFGGQWGLGGHIASLFQPKKRNNFVLLNFIRALTGWIMGRYFFYIYSTDF